MVRFKSILAPIDFSEATFRVLDVAVAMASQFQAHLLVFHATWLESMTYSSNAEGFSPPLLEPEAAASDQLGATVERLQTRYVKTSGAVLAGEPCEMILAVAKQREVDLIIMGTHGRRGLSRAILGSVTERVVRLSPVPVLTISMRAEPGPANAAGRDHVERQDE